LTKSFKHDKLLIRCTGEGDMYASSELDKYLTQMRHYPVLSRDEETALVIRFQTDNDKVAMDRLVCCNHRLVIKLVFKIGTFGLPVMDLVQQGNLGLVIAAQPDRYDPNHGTRFTSYAGWWIRNLIISHISDHLSLMKIGTTWTKQRILSNVRKALEQVDREHPGLPNSRRIKHAAELLDAPEEIVEEVLVRSVGEASLSTPLTANKDVLLGDRIVDWDPNPEQRSSMRTTAEHYNELISLGFQWVLNEREQRIIWERILKEEPVTLEEAGQIFHFTRERARQIEAKALRKLHLFFDQIGAELDFFRESDPIPLGQNETVIPKKKILKLLTDHDPMILIGLEQLTEDQKRILTLRYRNGKKTAPSTIAQRLGISSKQVIQEEAQALCRLDQIILDHIASA